MRTSWKRRPHRDGSVGVTPLALAPGQNPSEVAASIARYYGGEPRAVYDSVINGFQFVGPDDACGEWLYLRATSVRPDYEMHLAESSASVHLAAINQPAAYLAGRRGAGIRIGVLQRRGSELLSDLRTHRK